MGDANDRNGHGGTMLAMVLDAPHKPLRQVRVPIPVPNQHELLIKISACGVCRTDLHIIDGDLPMHKSPLIIGHEIVGVITHIGSLVEG
ncbi:MAG: alcohol dehydrogenase catalytic domain-containing protein, partial [Burkholderiaceae bacterium]